MTSVKQAILVTTACISLSACGKIENADQSASSTSDETKTELNSIYALSGDTWNVAEVGQRVQRMKGPAFLVEDLWLIERETGATFSLMPDNTNRIDEAYFLTARLGPIKTFDRYSDSKYLSDKGSPTHYIFRVWDTDGERTSLYAGKLADKTTVKLGGPYGSILYMEMLADNQMAVYVAQGEQTQRVVFDLNTLSEASSNPIKP